MAIVRMQKLRIYVYRDVATDVFAVIQKLGNIEFNRIEQREGFTKTEKTMFEFNYASSRLDFAVTFLSKYEQPKNLFSKIKTALEGGRIPVTEEKIEELMQTFYFNDIIEKVEDIEEKLNDATNKIKNLEEEMELLRMWETIDVPLSLLQKTKTTNTIALSGDKESIDTLIEVLENNKVLFAVTAANEKNILLTHFQKDEARITKEVLASGLEITELPKRRGTPKEELERIGRALAKTEKEKGLLLKEAKALVRHLPKLKIISDRIFWKKEKHNLLSQALKRGDVLMFEGWCPEAEIETLKMTLEKKTPLFAIETIKPDEMEKPPVEIKNNKIVAPFETITRLYGLPGEKDLDPTPFLAGFFFIFFGLSLTDVGYGLFLFLVTVFILTFFNVPKDTKPLISLLMLGGISSFIIGMLFGGYFGIDMKYLPEWAQQIQTFDPIANPLPVFYLALSFGIVQIMFGLILKIVREAKNGQPLQGVLDNGPWLALFAVVVVFILNKSSFISVNTETLQWAAYITIASLILTQGRKERGAFKKLFKGVFSLYDSIGFFSDVLSYSRLLALGLATSALAFAVNLIANIVSDMIPYVGPTLMVLILVVGHLFNLAVNVLGAFIHSARLQFVEFFGKFITDSGKVFTPFKRKERYIVVR